MANTIISDLPALTPASGTVLYAENSSQSGKIDYATLAQAIIENYTSSTLAGSAQSVKSALDSLNSKTTTITGSFTLDSNQSSAANNLNVKQVGNMVVIWGYVAGLTLTANTETTIGTIGGVSFPSAAVRLVGSVGANAYSGGTLSYVAISASGNVVLKSSNGGSNKAVMFNAIYAV